MPCELPSFILEEINFDFHMDFLRFVEATQCSLVDSLVLGGNLQGVEQKLSRIGLPSLVLLELLGELSRDGNLLGLQETFKKHLDGEINIVSSDMVSEMDLGMSL